MPAYLSRVDQTVPLPAGVATPVDVAVDGARDWTYLLINTGDNPITAATAQYGALGAGDLTDPEAVPAALLAAGARTPIVGTSRPVTLLRLVLTSTLGTTVRVAGGGW